jgi:hypothetical protein
MQDPRQLNRRSFLETAETLMTAGTFAHLATRSVEGRNEKLDLASPVRSNRGGLDEVRWAPRVNPSLIRRLYEADARGIVDDELFDDVGSALHARCQSILAGASRGAERPRFSAIQSRVRSCHRTALPPLSP